MFLNSKINYTSSTQNSAGQLNLHWKVSGINISYLKNFTVLY